MPQEKVIAHVGPMFSSKTTTVMSLLAPFVARGIPVKVFCPARDTRSDHTTLISHGGFKLEISSIVVGSSWEILSFLDGVRTICIEEGQFFDEDLPTVLQLVCDRGVRVLFAGLDYQWDGVPFPTTMRVLALPVTKVFKVRAVCDGCGNLKGTRSQKLHADGTPVSLDEESPVIQVGAKNLYRPLCDRCWFETTPGATKLLERSVPVPHLSP